MTTLVTGRRAGFTLIEILVVISLLVILIAVLVANTIAVGQRAFISSTKTLFRRIDLGMGTYTDRVGFFPPDGMDTTDDGQEVVSREGIPIRSSACLYERLGRDLTVEKPAPGGRVVVERYSSPILRFREMELFRLPDDEVKTVAELLDAWGVPIHYDRLEGPNSYSVQDGSEEPAVHLEELEYHPLDPREMEGVIVTRAGEGQNIGKFDLWSHGSAGHDDPADRNMTDEEQVENSVVNWDRPRKE